MNVSQLEQLNLDYRDPSFLLKIWGRQLLNIRLCLFWLRKRVSFRRTGGSRERIGKPNARANRKSIADRVHVRQHFDATAKRDGRPRSAAAPAPLQRVGAVGACTARTMPATAPLQRVGAVAA